MEPINELIVVKVTEYSGTTTKDKNEKQTLMLQCAAGRMPNRNVLAGTVAERAGLELGKTYLVQVKEQGNDVEFGRAFNWIVLDELHGTEIITAQQMLGKPEIIDIPKPEGFEDAYHRKGTAVESNVTMRIRNGKFEPAYPRSVSHATAREVIKGTSTENWSNNHMDSSKLKVARTSEEIKEKFSEHEESIHARGEEGDLSGK